MATNTLITLTVFWTSFSVILLVILSQKWHVRYSSDEVDGAQKFHSGIVPRVGGLGIYLGLVFGSLYNELPFLSELVVAGSLIFFAGFYEDITKHGGIKIRLLTSFISGAFAYYLIGFGISETHIPVLDYLLQNSTFTLIFTAVAVAGVANSINIIDGFNGLASGIAIMCFSAFSLIAYSVSDYEIAALSGLGIVSIAGFMLFNFPRGRIFLGDGGAYFIGFYLAWIAIMLPVRHESISPLSSLLVCSYPIIETLFSVVRKSLRKNYHPGKPDRVHFHMLVYSRIACKLTGREWPTELRNALTSPLIWLFNLFPISLALYDYSQSNYLTYSIIFVCILYLVIYWSLVRFKLYWIQQLGEK